MYPNGRKLQDTGYVTRGTNIRKKETELPRNRDRLPRNRDSLLNADILVPLGLECCPCFIEKDLRLE